jgi:hypothetical protein
MVVPHQGTGRDVKRDEAPTEAGARLHLDRHPAPTLGGLGPLGTPFTTAETG